MPETAILQFFGPAHRDWVDSFHLNPFIAREARVWFAEDACRDYAGRAFSRGPRRPTDAVA